MSKDKSESQDSSENKPVFMEVNTESYSKLTPAEQLMIARRIHSGFIASLSESKTKATETHDSKEKSD